MKTLSLKISDEISNKLILRAKQDGINKSEIVRRAVEEYLSKKPSAASGSFFEMAEDLAGSVEGPADLSHNKEYMKNYGK